MNAKMIQINIPDNAVSRQDIIKLVRETNPTFSEGQIKRLIKNMVVNTKIEHVGRNKYKKINNKVNTIKYINKYSEKSLKIIEIMQKEFPLLEYRIWELSWLNEFFNHQLSRNYIFLEVENEGCEFVFERLTSEFEGKVLLKPNQEQIIRYGTNDSIIIDRLICEAPKGKNERYNLAIEKLIVDLFANKRLKEMLSLGDYSSVLENIFTTYEVDQVKMFRYARRRNKEKELFEFLNNKTNVEVKVI